MEAIGAPWDLKNDLFTEPRLALRPKRDALRASQGSAQAEVSESPNNC